VLAPTGTPTDVLNFLNSRIVKIMSGSEMQKRMTQDGLVAIGSGRSEFASHIKVEIEKWARVIRASHATVD
jgi:tripartite-type tricarboxylate transporter receptor subunit TctC